MNWIRLPARNSCSTATKASTWSGNKSYAANALNQYIVADNGAMGYDANGNTLTLPNNLGLTYNSLDQLVSANNGTSLAYDPLGRLAYLSGGNGTVRFDYEGQDLISEIDGGGNVLRRYVHADGVDEPLVWYEGASVNDRRWLHSDERGSVIATSNASGTQTSTNRYDSYGVPASGNVGRFQYTGQTWLPELGMYYYKSRMLAPQVGRFNQPDAIGVAGGVNLYRYVGNDPINYTDPSGLKQQILRSNGMTCTMDVANDGKVTNMHCTEDNPGPDIVVSGGGGFGGTTICRGNCSGGGGGGVISSPSIIGGGGGGGGGTSGPASPQNDDCAKRDSLGKCQLVRDNRGKLQLDLDYAKKTCQNYKSMMAANRYGSLGNLALSVPGTANAGLGGTIGWLSKTAGVIGGRFMTFTRGVVGLTTGLLSWGGAYSAPEGCK